MYPIEKGIIPCLIGNGDIGKSTGVYIGQRN
jgi:hypothetical protein